MKYQIQQRVRVDFTYPCVFTEGVFLPGNLDLVEALRPGLVVGCAAKVLVVIDSGVAEQHPDLVAGVSAYCLHYRDTFTLVAAPCIVPGGELVKHDDKYVRQIQALVNEHGIDRHAFLFAIGGGAVLDMVGYAAAVSHRGVRLVRFPTTVLAQNDSGVGVKNGINAFEKKNFLGTFAPPFAVLNDFGFLRTLSDRDWRAGISEAVKVALIKDAPFFDFLEQHADRLVGRDMAAMQELILRCARLHLDHIATSGDPFELGSSRPLDFGHWAAHKLEQLSGYRIRHGEAVAIGIALDATYSMMAGMLHEGAWERILQLLHALGFRLFERELWPHPERSATPAILRGLAEFREHLGGELTVMLLHDIGQGFETHEMDENRILRSLEILRHWQKQSDPTILEEVAL